MDAARIKFVYTVREDMPKGTIIVSDGTLVFPATEGDLHVPIGVVERDCKQGEPVLYNPSGDTADISHAILTKGLPYVSKPKASERIPRID